MRLVPILPLALAGALAAAASTAWAQTAVRYGRITNVTMMSESDARARMGGALVGGALGASLGSGRRGANRALGGIGGAVAGDQIGRLASQRQVFEYTVLLDGTTQRVISDQAGKRAGDCVAVETGAFTNIRLVPDARCGPPAGRPTQAAVEAADACVQAKEQLLAATTDADFDRAERRVRLLCGE
jgi:outer membrane lipoprotein SlyB